MVIETNCWPIKVGIITIQMYLGVIIWPAVKESNSKDRIHTESTLLANFYIVMAQTILEGQLNAWVI